MVAIRIVFILLIVAILRQIIWYLHKKSLVSRAAAEDKETPMIRLAKYVVLGLVLIAIAAFAIYVFTQ
jgi:hypothetical protein